jgi:hypothetical protein
VNTDAVKTDAVNKDAANIGDSTAAIAINLALAVTRARRHSFICRHQELRSINWKLARGWI